MRQHFCPVLLHPVLPEPSSTWTKATTRWGWHYRTRPLRVDQERIANPANGPGSGNQGSFFGAPAASALACSILRLISRSSPGEWRPESFIVLLVAESVHVSVVTPLRVATDGEGAGAKAGGAEGNDSLPR